MLPLAITPALFWRIESPTVLWSLDKTLLLKLMSWVTRVAVTRSLQHRDHVGNSIFLLLQKPSCKPAFDAFFKTVLLLKTSKNWTLSDLQNVSAVNRVGSSSGLLVRLMSDTRLYKTAWAKRERKTINVTCILWFLEKGTDSFFSR